MQSTNKRIIKTLVKTTVESFAQKFKARHEGEVNNPDGVINMKIHNVFIEALGKEIQYYTSLVRSLDSSFGNMLESLAIEIAKLTFVVNRKVEGPLTDFQTANIAKLLEKYKRREMPPSIEDYQCLRTIENKNKSNNRQHNRDYYLIDSNTNIHYLIELKIGGDLDNKKARSEKEAILEQFAILSNVLTPDTKIKIFFATAYNRFGVNKTWNQQRVKQFFADQELLIGKDFWNFVCRSDEGYNTVLEAYRESAPCIKQALESIKKTFLG